MVSILAQEKNYLELINGCSLYIGHASLIVLGLVGI